MAHPVLQALAGFVGSHAAEFLLLSVHEAVCDAGLAADHPVTVAAKLMLELLKTKAELEWGSSEFVLDCTACRPGGALGGPSRQLVEPGYWGTPSQRRTGDLAV